MKTAIIDRSLVGLEFLNKTNPYEVYAFVKALKEAGANYIEIDFNALLRLPKPIASDNYIYRFRKRSDILIVKNLPFSYVVLPLNFSYLINQIKIPIVLEVEIGNLNLDDLIKVLAEGIDLSKISLLRLCGDFRHLPDEINEFIKCFRSYYSTPLDFCPTDSSLNALTICVSAFASNAESVTMSFGNSDNFASLEEFVITLVTMYHIIVKNTYISGICKASILSGLFSTIKTDNLKIILEHYEYSPKFIPRVDSNNGIPPRQLKKEPEQKKSIYEKSLSSMDIDEELGNVIADILKSRSMNLLIPPVSSGGYLN